ncbi:HupE/UreJ family protein [Aestuariivirga sp.]|uniref:HupE/UreJ family protein n=1 Tax=Aestuariivirga sp. TaxID=2650926 RepID=UPI003017A252
MALPATAHEIRPAYLQLDETAPAQFSVLWKVPAAGDRRLALYLRFPAECQTLGEPAGTIDGGAYFERWKMSCDGGLKGRSVTVDGLRTSMTDVLARISWTDGTTEVARLTPEHPALTLKGAQSILQVAWTYFVLGVEHILSGVDHLLFVLALMLLIRERWMLFKTITAFTLAHSITLVGATLGYFSLPQKPVEATIALSIAFVASELIKMKPGERRLSEAYPWVVAFSFGLLHGFGFAGALTEIGLPQKDVPLALLTFNLGVEAGQLMFVGFVLLLYAAVRTVTTIPLTKARVAGAYVIGTIAIGWFLERLAGFVTS